MAKESLLLTIRGLITSSEAGGDRLNTKTSLYEPPKSEEGLVLAWIRRTRESQLQHYEMANLLARRDKLLGIPVIILTAIIGVSAFWSVVYEALPVYTPIIVGLLSISAAVFSSLQTFFKFSEQSEKHRLAAVKFGSIRRKLEAHYAGNDAKSEGDYLNALREEMDDLAEASPNVPVRIFKKIQNNTFYTSRPTGEKNP